MYGHQWTRIGVARSRDHRSTANTAATAVVKLTEDRERLIGAVLLGNNLVNILASALATSLFANLFPGGAGVAIATAVMTILVLVFAEVTPKTAAIARPEAFAMTVARPMQILVRIFAPITAIVQFIVRNIFGVGVVDYRGMVKNAGA